MNAQALIQIYRTGFFICAAVAVLGLALSVLFFIRFRIGAIWAVRTGRAQKKAVYAMQETELLETEILENYAFSFRVTQQIVLVHTEERISQKGDGK